MATTPYELRFNMMLEAKNYLEQQYIMDRENLTQRYYAEVEAGLNPGFPELPNYPTFEEITALANSMNEFVSQR
jgi:hypothetical protein